MSPSVSPATERSPTRGKYIWPSPPTRPVRSCNWSIPGTEISKRSPGPMGKSAGFALRSFQICASRRSLALSAPGRYLHQKEPSQAWPRHSTRRWRRMRDAPRSRRKRYIRIEELRSRQFCFCVSLSWHTAAWLLKPSPQTLTGCRASVSKARTGDGYWRLNVQIMNPLLSAEPLIDRRSEVGLFNEAALPRAVKP